MMHVSQIRVQSSDSKTCLAQLGIPSHTDLKNFIQIAGSRHLKVQVYKDCSRVDCRQTNMFHSILQLPIPSRLGKFQNTGGSLALRLLGTRHFTQVLRDKSHGNRMLPNRLLYDIDVHAILRHLTLVLDVTEGSAPARMTCFRFRVQLALQIHLQWR